PPEASRAWGPVYFLTQWGGRALGRAGWPAGPPPLPARGLLPHLPGPFSPDDRCLASPAARPACAVPGALPGRPPPPPACPRLGPRPRRLALARAARPGGRPGAGAGVRQVTGSAWPGGRLAGPARSDRARGGRESSRALIGLPAAR